MLPQLGFGLFRIGAVWGAILLIYTTSIVSLKTGVFSKGIARAGFVLGAIPLILITPIPMITIPIWVLVISIVMLRQQSSSDARPATG